MKLSITAAAAALAFVASTAAQAAPLPISGGTTAVTLTSAATLGSLGLGVAGLGSATLSPGSTGIPIAYFAITGGSIDTNSFAGRIQHAGSGLRLFTSSASISLTNFLIDTTTGVLSGSVAFGSTSLSAVPLFNIGTSGVLTSPFSLALTSTAAGALSTVFGVGNLTGTVIGTANTLPITTAVPEPATVASMLAGLALVGGLMSRQKRQRRESTPA